MNRAAFAGLLVAGALAAAAAPRPNIVFILADDLGWGDLSCHGQAKLRTPNLDRLAAEGMRFTRHYAGSTVCAPSRCVLMTGLHTGHAPVRTNWDAPMADSVPTLAGRLKAAGYATGGFGKWGIGNVIPEDDPNRKGFDRFYGYVDMFHAHNFFPPFLVRDGRREPLRNDVIPGSDGDRFAGRGNGVAQTPKDYAPDFIMNEALRFIDDRAGGPFFLYLAFNTPHANNEGQKYGRGMEVPDFGPFADRDWPDAEKGFARMMLDLDRNVGRVLAKLLEHGIADTTLVIFTSDNGPHQEGGHEVDFFDSNGPLRGRKRDLYEGGVRVPAIAWWPGRVPAAATCGRLSGFQDWMPTLCELAGVAAPESDGLSLAPTLIVRAEETEPKRHEYLYWEFYEGGGKQAVVTDRWKAVRLNWNDAPDGALELYDLQADAAEEHNIAADHPDVVGRMRRFMAAAHRPHTGILKSPWAPDGAKPNQAK